MIAPLIGAIVRCRGWLIGAALVAGVVASVYALRTAPLDAIPDISDPQIIVYAKWPRSPQLLETEVTEPIIRALPGRRRSSRSAATSHMGYSFIYVILQERAAARRRPAARHATGSTRSARSCPPTRTSASARTPAAWAGSTSTRWSISEETARPARAAAAEREPDQARAADGAGRRRGRVGRRAREAISDEDVSAAARGRGHLAASRSSTRCRARFRRPAAARSRSPTATTSCAASSSHDDIDKLEVPGRRAATATAQPVH